MMRTIELLDRTTIDKIAAGEVVERPSSVVKELLENAIDASATAITVEIKDGGKTFIRITDNGSGIEKDEVKKAFLRHATSKIRKVEDLQQVATLGFRGEALSSISAVSQMEVITKTSDALTGVRYRIEGGIEKEFEEIGAPAGTTFLINHLFYNVPARAKFLKSTMAEGNRVAAVVEELALSHPEISFKFIMNGQNRLYTSGNGNLKDIVYQIFGRDMTKELISIDRETELMHIQGFIGNPIVARGNRNFENYFINGRYVKSNVIAKAIEDGYHGFLMQHKYPFTLLYIDIDPTKVDVNVHPAKMEIRISEAESVYHQLCLAIQNTLMERERIPDVSLNKETKKTSEKSASRLPVIHDSLPEPFEMKKIESLRPSSASTAKPVIKPAVKPVAEPVVRPGVKPVYNPVIKPVKENEPTFNSLTSQSKKDKNTIRETSSYGTSSIEHTKQDAPFTKSAQDEKAPLSIVNEQNVKNVEEEKPFNPVQTTMFDNKVLSENARKHHKIIGQVFGTYWIVEYDEKMYIIDQHAAHEKVLYEKIMKDYKAKVIHSQMLYPAKLISIPANEKDVLERNLEVFQSLGFEIESFGGNEYKITAVPNNLYNIAENELFNEILDQLSQLGEVNPELIPEKLASMSCKAAIKGNHDYSMAEAEALIDELLKLENPYNCPHGRPTIISMSKYELDKKFKRIV